MEMLTIDGFCRAAGISRSMYYKLGRQGRGPQAIRIGRVYRITKDAVADWQARMEKETVMAR